MAVITSITGLQNLPNLQNFNADWNGLVSVDLSNLSNLLYVDVSDCEDPSTNNNSLTSVNLSGSTAILELRLDDSNFSAGIPNISALSSLQIIDLDGSNISGILDFSGFPALLDIDVSSNAELTSVIISDTQPITGLSANNCALTETAIDDILVVLSNNGQPNGFAYLDGGTNAIPSGIGLAAKVILQENGWTVTINEPTTTTTTTI